MVRRSSENEEQAAGEVPRGQQRGLRRSSGQNPTFLSARKVLFEVAFAIVKKRKRKTKPSVIGFGPDPNYHNSMTGQD